MGRPTSEPTDGRPPSNLQVSVFGGWATLSVARPRIPDASCEECAYYPCGADFGFEPREEEGILRAANSLEVGELALAVAEGGAGLARPAAENLVAHRDGPDATPGTADDDRYDDLAELRSVAEVTETTLDKLLAHAHELGLVTPWFAPEGLAEPPGSVTFEVEGDVHVRRHLNPVDGCTFRYSEHRELVREDVEFEVRRDSLGRFYISTSSSSVYAQEFPCLRASLEARVPDELQIGRSVERTGETPNLCVSDETYEAEAVDEGHRLVLRQTCDSTSSGTEPGTWTEDEARPERPNHIEWELVVRR